MVALIADSTLSRLADWMERVVLKERCSLLRLQRVPTPSGGSRDTWIEVNTNVKCAILDAGSPAEQIIAQQTVGAISKIILFANDTDIRGNDRVRLDSLTYLIVDLFEPSSYQVCIRVLTRRTSLPT